MSYTIRYMLYLIGCAAKDTVPDIPAEPLDYELMFKLSKEHQSENLVYASLERINADVPGEIMHKFRQCYEKAIAREAKQELELQNICAAFSEAEIRHIPLKGSVVKNMYPSPDLRQNGDIDILVDTKDEKTIKRIMTGIGFEAEAVTEKVLSFYKGKLHIEVHRHLLEPSDKRRGFFENIWETVSPVNGFTYEMTPEIQYTFLLAHIANHLLNGGAGIKLITDLYVFDRPLDQLILNACLRETGLDTLNGIIRRLIDFWFGMKQSADDPVLFVSEYILKNGVYGNAVTSVRMGFSDIDTRGGKLSKYFKMTFRPYDTMKYLYPVLRKAPVLLPLCYGHRVFEKLTRDRSRIKQVAQGSRGSNDMHVLSEFKKIL